MDYTKILKRALEITWRYKALWLFGFLLAFFSGSGGNIGRGFEYRMRPGDQLPPGLIWGIVLFALVLILVLVIAGIVITSISRGALIGMVHEVEETEHTTVRSGWRIGWARFLPLIGIDLVTAIPLLIIALTLVALGLSPLVLLFFQKRVLTILGILLTVFFMLLVIGLLIVVGAAFGLWRDFAYRQCVLKRKGILDSLRDGYHIVRQNLQRVSLMWLLLFGIDLLVGLIMAPLAFAAFAMVAAPTGMLYVATKSALLAILLALLMAIPVILLLAFLGGIYQVYRSATWTLTYLALQAEPHSP